MSGQARPTLEVTTEPTDADREVILNGLVGYNESKVGHTDFSQFGIRLRNSSGNIIGGLMGRWFYQWLFVELLFVPENLRGQGVGTELMRKAEAFAADHGCVGIWLDTFAFQARGFYEKLGFSVFGQIDDFPPGSQRYFLQKRI